MSTRKGQKGQKNIPYLYNEVKTRHNVLLTPTAWQILQDLAEIKGMSVSEIIEQWARDTVG